MEPNEAVLVMPLQQIDILPNFDAADARGAMSRWVGHDNIAEKVVELLRAQDREYVQREFEAGHLGIIKNNRDLAGLDLSGEAFAR